MGIKIAGIYKITSPNGRIYIGQSWNIKQREYQYNSSCAKKQPYLYKSILKYGWKAHKFEIIHEIPQDSTQEVMDRYETLYWELYKECKVSLMNVREPGSRGKNSLEMRKKMSENSFYKGKIGINSPSFGTKRSIETREKMSLLNKQRDPDWRKSFRKIMYQYSLEGDLVNSYLGVRNKTTDFVKLLNKYCNRYTIINSHNFIWSKNLYSKEEILNLKIKTINHKNGTEQFFKGL